MRFDIPFHGMNDEEKAEVTEYIKAFVIYPEQNPYRKART